MLGGQGATPACWEQCSYPALEDIRFFCAFVRRASRHDLRQLTAVVLHVSASSISVSAFHAAAQHITLSQMESTTALRPVLALLQWCCPLAITRLVVPIVINALDGQLLGIRPSHV